MDIKNNFNKPNVIFLEVFLGIVMAMDIIIRLIVNKNAIFRNISLFGDLCIFILLIIIFGLTMINGNQDEKDEIELFLIFCRYISQICRISNVVYRTKKNFDKMHKGNNIFVQDIKLNYQNYANKKKRDSDEMIEIV